MVKIELAMDVLDVLVKVAGAVVEVIDKVAQWFLVGFGLYLGALTAYNLMLWLHQ